MVRGHSSDRDRGSDRVGDVALGVRTLVELRDVVVEGVGPVSLVLHDGEILVVFGLLGSGRTELLEGIYGARPIGSGAVLVGGLVTLMAYVYPFTKLVY